MVVASFLCKHLLIQWQRGEVYLPRKLLDYDMSANVGTGSGRQELVVMRRLILGF
jgi:deoxyribodipyrimidine photolyase